MKRILLISFMLCSALIGELLAQDRTVTGKVSSAEDGDTLPGVNVMLKGTSTGVTTDIDGNFTISVPSEGGTLVFSFIGLALQEVQVGSRSVIDVKMTSDIKQLGEVVVTGVATGTSTKKLGFAVGKIGEEMLQEVPAVDAGNALRGKVSGVQIIQGNGLQGSAPSIRLRGANNISTSISQEPLIIIDGIITPPGSSALADINMNDVESIEVIKGAAGASLYGSLAGNGVVQILTKRGARESGTTRVTVRNEFGVSQIQRKMPVNMHHAFEIDSNGQLALDANGQPFRKAEIIHDNPWDEVYDHQGELFGGRGFMNNYVSVASSTKNTNFMASFDNTDQGGIIEGIASFSRQNMRLNVDHHLNDKFKVSLSTLYTLSEGPSVAGQGGQSGLVYEVVRLNPNTNIRANNFDGQPFNTTNIGGIFNVGRNVNNPLYTAHNDKITVNRQRFLANATASYQIADWWKVEGQFSLDRADRNYQRYRDVNYLNINSGAANPYSNSLLTNEGIFNSAQIATFSSYFNKTIGDFKLGGVLRYQGEQYGEDYKYFSGNNLEVPGIRQEQIVPIANRTVETKNELFRAENIFGNVSIDYKDKYIVEALLRNDRSSLFGSDVRSQMFYRLNGVYRVSEDVKIPGVQEFKLRGAYGTSGQRPPFEAQYETYQISGGLAVPGRLGNSNLKPSKVKELEVGTNIYFLNRFAFEFNYAKTNADDQILEVPLSQFAGGYTTQWQNAASVASNTFEFSLSATILEKPNFRWEAGVVGSRTKSIVTSLNRAAYQIGGGAVGSGGIFKIEEGEVFGAIHGNVIATDLNQLQTNEAGFVSNLDGAPEGLSIDDFAINGDGFVIRKGTEFTAGERVYFLRGEDGARIVEKIGDTTPDIILGLSNTVSYKGLSLYFLMDSQIGGDIANINKSNMLFNTIAAELDQSARPVGERRYEAYYLSLSNSGQGPTQYLIESGTYLTLREVALSYSFSNSFFQKLGGFGKVFYDAKLSLVGRNLYTFSNYSGWTPEVAATGGSQRASANPFNFRADYGAVPLFRTYSASVQFRF